MLCETRLRLIGPMLDMKYIYLLINDYICLFDDKDNFIRVFNRSQEYFR